LSAAKETPPKIPEIASDTITTAFPGIWLYVQTRQQGSSVIDFISIRSPEISAPPSHQSYPNHGQ
jgi:hypothetical protein